MRIYTRYVLFQTIKLFSIALIFSTVGLLFFFIVKTSEEGVPYALSFRLTPYVVPDLLSKSLPIASLMAATLFFAKMGGNHEIIALKALGVAPWRVLAPVWIFMFIVSLSSVWLNDLSTSWSRMQMKRVLLEGLESTILTQLREEGRFTTPDNKCVVEASKVEPDGTLIGLSFSAKIAGDEEISGDADSAKIVVDLASEKPLVNILLNNTEVTTSRSRAFLPKNFKLPVPLDQFFRSSYRVDPSATKIKEALDNLEAEKKTFDRKLASSAIFDLLCGNITTTSQEEWKERADFEKRLKKQRYRFNLTIPRVWASGFACFFFTWVGAPFAVWFNKSDYTAAFFACFLPVLIVYFPLFTFGLEGAKSGAVPPCFVWLGNVALGFIGWYFLKKIH